MVPTTLVFGHSDDLIEIEGAIREEFTYEEPDPRGDLLAFSDGTILRIDYSEEGVWRISPVVRGSAELTIELAPENDESNYSDRAVLVGPVSWVVQGIAMASAKTPVGA